MPARPCCRPQGATVLNHVTWSPLARFAHAAVIAGPPSVVAYSEVVEDAGRRVLVVSLGVRLALLGSGSGCGSSGGGSGCWLGLGGAARGHAAMAAQWA